MRLAHLRPEELDEEQRALYDALTADTRVDRTLTMRVSMTDEAGRLQGPFNAMLHQPRIGDALQELSRRLRFDGVLTKRTREIVILVVAASQRSEFEWAGHEPIARSLGLTDDEIDALATGRGVAFSDAAEDAACALARSVVQSGDADDPTYDRAQRSLGDAGVFEISTTVAFYQLLAQQMRLFRVPAPPGPWSDDPPR